MKPTIKRQLAKEIIIFIFILLLSVAFYLFFQIKNYYYTEYCPKSIKKELSKIAIERQKIPNRTESFYNKMKDEFYYRIYKEKKKIVNANGKTFTFDSKATDKEIGEAIDDYFSGNTVEVNPKFDYIGALKEGYSMNEINEYLSPDETMYKNIKSNELENYINENWKVIEAPNGFKECIFYFVSIDRFQELLQNINYRKNLFECYIQNTEYNVYEASAIDEYKNKEKYKQAREQLNSKHSKLEMELKNVFNKAMSDDEILYYLSRILIILLILLYPVRGIYFLFKWAIQTLKNDKH
mgnify:CR=1 FL=1|jgi:hypothetical protein